MNNQGWMIHAYPMMKEQTHRILLSSENHILKTVTKQSSFTVQRTGWQTTVLPEKPGDCVDKTEILIGIVAGIY